MFEKAFGWLSSVKNQQSSPWPSSRVGALTSKFVSTVSRILGTGVPNSAPKRELTAKELSDSAFFARLNELRARTKDAKYSQGSRNRLSQWLDAAEAYHASGGFPYASDWWFPMENAAKGLVDVSGLSSSYRERLSEAELTDVLDTSAQLAYYRTLDLAKTALEDADVTQTHVATVVSMLDREARRLHENPRVAKTLSLRASFSEFRAEIETMDLRDYTLGSLRSMSVDFQAVIAASKHETWTAAYDAAVSKLFKSFSELVHLRSLKSAVSELETFLSKNRSFGKRWNLSEYAEALISAKKALTDPNLSKKDADVHAVRTNSALVALRAAASSTADLDAILGDASSKRPDDFSRGSYAALLEFVSKAAANRDVSNIAELVIEWRGVLASLVDVSRLKGAILATRRSISSESYRRDNPETFREVLNRLEFACEVLSKTDPKHTEAAFALSALESFVPYDSQKKGFSIFEKVRRSVAWTLWGTDSARA